jgi:hypothetical protein
MGDRGFDLFVRVLDAWQPRCSLRAFVEPYLWLDKQLCSFFAKNKQMNM